MRMEERSAVRDGKDVSNSSGAEKVQQSSSQAGLPEKASLPRITGLSTAFPYPEETQPYRMGEDRGPRRHASGE